MAKLKNKVRSGQRGPGKSSSGDGPGNRPTEAKPETSMVGKGITDDLRYLKPQEAADLRNQGLSSFWRQVQRGELPQPYRVSPRCPRWLLSDILPKKVTAANDNEA
jgi:predicted DNA-binding transcriptional regulator AlpA